MRQKRLEEPRYRPRTPAEDQKTLTFKVYEDLRQKAKAVAFVKGLKVGDIVSEAIAGYLDEVVGRKTPDFLVDTRGKEGVEEEAAMEVL